MITARVTARNDKLHVETSNGLTASGGIVEIIKFLLANEILEVTMPDWREDDAPTSGQKIAIFHALKSAKLN